MSILEDLNPVCLLIGHDFISRNNKTFCARRGKKI